MAITASGIEEIKLEQICSYWATLAPPEIIGPVPGGVRANFYVKEGELSGPKLRGRFRQVGGDWLLFRTDGIGIVDVRATVELDSGALVYITYGGVVDLGPDGYEQFLAGNLPPKARLQITPRFLTADPDYLWLNRLQCIGVGEVDTTEMKVIYDVYSVR